MKINPFRFARKSVRVSQTLAGELSGVSRQSISVLERGGRSPRSEELLHLASLFRLRPEILLSAKSFSLKQQEIEGAIFRSAAQKKLEPQDRIELSFYRRVLERWPREHGIPDVSNQRTTHARCELLREHLGFAEPPFDIFKALYQKGLMLEFTAFSTLAGALLRDSGDRKAAIVINSDQPDDRLRFSTAHDLAHLAAGHPSEDPYLLDYFGPSRTEAEREADLMAAELLIPVHRLLKEVRELDKDEELPILLYRLADRFRVSYAAMAVRLGDVGALTPDLVIEMRKVRPTEIEDSLKLQAKRKARFRPGEILPAVIDELEAQGRLPTGWEEDFSLETGPLHLRWIQSAALQKYILDTQIQDRRHSVTEVYERAASWVAKNYPWD